MPKEIYKIEGFHGGLNNASDPRDIADNQLAMTEGISISSIGTIKPAGHSVLINYETEPDASISAGDEVFYMKHDKSLLHQGGVGTPADITTDYLLMGHDSSSGNTYIYEKNSVLEDWSDNSIFDNSITDHSGPFELTYYNADGGIRVSPTYDIGYTAQSTCIVPVKRVIGKANSGDAGLYTANKWTVGPAECSKPGAASEYLATDVDEAAATSSLTLFDNIPSVNVNLKLVSSPAGSGFCNANTKYKWFVAVSFEYDDNQESALQIISTGGAETVEGTADPDAALKCRIFVKFPTSAPRWYDRISGVNLYLKQESVDTDWWFAGKFSTTDGGHDGGFSASFWSTATGTAGFKSDLTMLVPQKYLTFDQHAEFVARDYNLRPVWKTGVIANRKAYIGNVRYYTGPTIASDWVVKSDMILASPEGKFDTFDPHPDGEGWLECSSGDGDEIVKLEHFNDRLVEFKTNKTTIINISQTTPFIESTLNYNGVMHKAAVSKTDFGIAWANKSGCWFYDGQSIANLIEKEGVPVIDKAIWKSFISDQPAIFYIPGTKQLGIQDDVTVASSGKLYIFDMVLQAWTYIPSGLSGDKTSGWVVNQNNDPMYYNTSSNLFYQWSSAPYSQIVNFKTKDITFGDPGLRKKIKRVLISYKGGVIGPLPHITKVECVGDVSDSLNQKYFDIDTHGGAKTFIWIDTDNSGSSAPSGSAGAYGDSMKVTQVGTNDSAERVAIAIASAINEDAGGHSTATVEGATVIITDAANQAITSSNISAGNTGFTLSSSQVGTASTAAQNIDVSCRINGSGSYIGMSGALTDSTGNAVLAELTPSVALSSIYSLQLVFYGLASATCEINDISIIYQKKRVK